MGRLPGSSWLCPSSLLLPFSLIPPTFLLWIKGVRVFFSQTCQHAEVTKLCLERVIEFLIPFFLFFALFPLWPNCCFVRILCLVFLLCHLGVVSRCLASPGGILNRKRNVQLDRPNLFGFRKSEGWTMLKLPKDAKNKLGFCYVQRKRKWKNQFKLNEKGKILPRKGRITHVFHPELWKAA